jgi:hypothetical protein
MKKLFLIFIIALFSSFKGHGQTMDYKEPNSTNLPSTQKIKVFPNPATNVVNILGLENSIKANIVISDIYGNMVLTHQWRIKNNALNIPISTLSSGIYIITIRSQEQSLQTKFYKQ